MSIRKDTTNRRTLYRACFVCGRTMTTTADTPFMRQMYDVNGKRQNTVYFCSESCKESTYRHHFDGLAWKRREARESNRDNAERNRRYYEAHRERERERAKQRYHAMSQEERDKGNAWRRRMRAIQKKEASHEA